MSLSNDIQDFSNLICKYSLHKAQYCGCVFEDQKKNVTKKIMKRRGQLSRPTVHLGMAGIVAGVLVGGSLVGNSSDQHSQFPEVDAATPQQIPETELASFIGTSLGDMSTETIISEKPRAEIVEHDVKGGETLSQIAEQYGLDTNTVKSANDMEDKDTIKPGQKLKILPVIGVAHQVQNADE